MRGELTLDEILSEPIVLTLMARDGVTEDEVRELAFAARERAAPAFLPAVPAGEREPPRHVS